MVLGKCRVDKGQRGGVLGGLNVAGGQGVEDGLGVVS